MQLSKWNGQLFINFQFNPSVPGVLYSVHRKQWSVSVQHVKSTGLFFIESGFKLDFYSIHCSLAQVYYSVTN